MGNMAEARRKMHERDKKIEAEKKSKTKKIKKHGNIEQSYQPKLFRKCTAYIWQCTCKNAYME